MRCAIVILLALTSTTLAQPFVMEPGPKSPAESLACIKVRPGFKVELMVAEPLVMDPIAFAWGPDGKFWVVEMGDYPLGVDGKNQPGGRIKYLEKSKADGPYDRMTVFMDKVGYPTGVFPYEKGILVTCAPDIFYAEVGQDGKAINKKVLFTGFNEGNQQHRVNGLVWGIDNWIYGANGDSGGVIKSLKTGDKVDIRGRDFRFKVETGEFEAVSGQSQFGRCRDDWGNWFGCNNSIPMFHFVLEDRYLKRNPHVLYPDVRVPVSVKPGAAPVYPISKPLPRFNSPTALNHFTSACSTIIYRDNLFGKDFEGNMFVSEPVHNLIHREVMKPKGVTFTSQRADDEQTSEFLASSDNWFRPTMIQVGPDGALWIADMYRYVIEHPEWIPKDWQKKLDLRAGHDLGRIYRVYPADRKPRDIVRLDKMKVAELVKQLESPSGWVRDTAHQLLLSQPNQHRNELKQELEKLFKTTTPQARLHAFHIYRLVTDIVSENLVAKLFQDKHPQVRKHVAAYAAFYAICGRSTPLLNVFSDPDPFVQQELAYALGELELTEPHLVRMLCAEDQDRYVFAAALSSVSKKNFKGVLDHAVKERSISGSAIGPLLKLASIHGVSLDASRLFLLQIEARNNGPAELQFVYVASLIESMEKSNSSVRDFLKNLSAPEGITIRARLKEIYDRAVKIIDNPQATVGQRSLAIRLLRRGIGDDQADAKKLVSLLGPHCPDELQGLAIQQLRSENDPRLAGLLLSRWRSFTPNLRSQILDALLSRPFWTSTLIGALKNKDIPANEIDAIRRQRLLNHKDATIRAAAEQIFATATSANRARVVDDYLVGIPDKADATHGAKLFAKACAVCHKLGDIGASIGPDLAAVGDKSVNGLVIAILDPNRAVEARYINYVATTKKGLTYNGVLSAETSTTITLIGADGKPQQLLRNELDEFYSSGKSMMPEGLEKDLSPQDLADIIAFVRGPLTPNPSPPRGEGRMVRADDDGAIRLLPAQATIVGTSIVIEKKYGNFGYWSNPADHVVWSVETPKAGRYDVWIYYACDPKSAGNTLVLQAGLERVKHEVYSTGSWDDYRGVNIGDVQLSAGRQEIIVRAQGAIRGAALADLKKVELSPR